MHLESMQMAMDPAGNMASVIPPVLVCVWFFFLLVLHLLHAIHCDSLDSFTRSRNPQA